MYGAQTWISDMWNWISIGICLKLLKVFDTIGNWRCVHVLPTCIIILFSTYQCVYTVEIDVCVKLIWEKNEKIAYLSVAKLYPYTSQMFEAPTLLLVSRLRSSKIIDEWKTHFYGIDWLLIASIISNLPWDRLW